MDMREAVRLAAENAYAKAHAVRYEPEKYEGQHEFLTKLDIEGLISEAIGPTPERTLDLLFQSGVNELASDRLGHIELDDYEFKLAQLRRLCKEKIKEIDQMLQHRCEFNDNDYCMTCGLDGRA
jgi:hypothetical protein